MLKNDGPENSSIEMIQFSVQATVLGMAKLLASFIKSLKTAFSLTACFHMMEPRGSISLIPLCHPDSCYGPGMA